MEFNTVRLRGERFIHGCSLTIADEIDGKEHMFSPSPHTRS